jgi:hypothetical protein
MGVTLVPRTVIRCYQAASGDFWYHVPGYGFVTWPAEQISEHAHYVLACHRPDSPVVQVRHARGFAAYLVRGPRQCKACLCSWICPDVRWARCWFGLLEQGWRFRMPHRRVVIFRWLPQPWDDGRRR